MCGTFKLDKLKTVRSLRHKCSLYGDTCKTCSNKGHNSGIPKNMKISNMSYTSTLHKDHKFHLDDYKTVEGV